MAIYHLSLKTISRSKGQSAIAASAYRSGERLNDEETGETKDFTNKYGVAYSEVQLPENAPKEYQNRQTLWNAVQKKESRSNAQLAREVEVALPTELPREKQIKLVHGYVQKNFVNEGMCADWSIHDKNDGNPHAHIMLTTRSINSKGNWMAKQKSTYVLDENGSKVPQIDSKTGQQKIGARGRKMWKRTTVPTNDWNNHDNAEKWRANWASSCNQYLEPAQQIDHRSYVRQEKEQIPTIHEGYVARQMGEKSERVQENQKIRADNQQLSILEKELEKVKNEIQQLVQKLQEVIHERIIKSGLNRTTNTVRSVESTKSTITDAGAEAKIRQRQAQRRESEIERANRELERSRRNNQKKSRTADRQSTISQQDEVNYNKGKSR